MDHQLLLPAVPHTPSSNLFLSLAPELKQTVFSALPNASTLESLALTCSSLYHTFLDAESLIIKSILHNQIGPDLMCDAIIVFKSRTLKPCDNDAVIALLKLYTEHNYNIIFQKWKLRDALAIGSLYDDIEFLTKGFASSTLSTNPVTGIEDTSPSPLSLPELVRIKRTFYRYELFCHISRSIFQGLGALDPDEPEHGSPQSLFFSVAPWENEQLACVQDYLFERLSIPFNDVAEHDVEWGESEVYYLNDWDERYHYWMENYLSLGLTYLRKIISTSAYDDRCHILKPQHKEGPPYRPFSDALMAQGYENNLPELEDYTEEDERVHIPAQLAIDDNKGPQQAWRWAYAENTNAYWYNMSEQKSLRQRGYVMWDSARLAQWGLLDHKWQEFPHKSVSSEEERRYGRMMRDSFETRHKIWRRGGRGWWSPGDESRIIWPPPGPPKRPKTMEPKQCWGNRNVWATDWETWRENL